MPHVPPLHNLSKMVLHCPNMDLIVAIAGGSGSGKTSFAHKVLKHCADLPVGIVNQDSYYRTPLPDHLRIHGRANFDHPEAFDWPLLEQHIEQLKNDQSIEMPTYDFTQSRRGDETQRLEPHRVVILEGIYALWNDVIRTQSDIKVFLDVDTDIRFIRRLHRDVRERGRTVDSIIQQYYDMVRPMHHEHIATTRKYADIVVGEETDTAASVLAARIHQVFRHE